MLSAKYGTRLGGEATETCKPHGHGHGLPPGVRVADVENSAIEPPGRRTFGGGSEGVIAVTE